MLTIHTTGDPLVPVQVQHAYADAVDDAHRSALLRQAYVHRGGHCTFTTGEMLAALRTLERRITTGTVAGHRPGRPQPARVGAGPRGAAGLRALPAGAVSPAVQPREADRWILAVGWRS